MRPLLPEHLCGCSRRLAALHVLCYPGGAAPAARGPPGRSGRAASPDLELRGHLTNGLPFAPATRHLICCRNAFRGNVETGKASR